MKKMILALLLILAVGCQSLSQSFYVKEEGLGKVYGPFKYEDGSKVAIAGRNFTIVTAKTEVAKPRAVASQNNTILVLVPYKYFGTWVFDDPTVGLKREAFVSGIPEMIEVLVKDIPNAKKGFKLLFSAEPFPDYDLMLDWRRPEQGGNWYYSSQLKREGWLCASLFKYFKTAPKKIYIKAEKK